MGHRPCCVLATTKYSCYTLPSRSHTHRSPTVMNGSSHSPTAIHGAPSTPNGFSNGPATSSTASLSTQHLPPACGARQLSKLKRFLTTLQQFGSDISPEIGERVRTLVLGLVVSLRAIRRPCSPRQPLPLALSGWPQPPSCSPQPSSQTWNLLLLSKVWVGHPGHAREPLDGAVSLQNSTLTIEEFHSKLQEATNFPLRPFVIPFLKVNKGSTLQATGTVYAKAPGREGIRLSVWLESSEGNSCTCRGWRTGDGQVGMWLDGGWGGTRCCSHPQAEPSE